MLIAFGAGIGFSVQQQSGADASGINGLLWPDPPAIPAFHLMDHNGQPFTRSELKNHWSLVFFGFTNCPDICPTTLDALAQVEQQLKANALWSEYGQVLFVSVDPERDSAERLAEYVQYFSPDFIGATAGEAALRDLTRAVGALFIKVEQGESYTMDHSAGLFFIDREGRLVSVLTPPHHPAAIAERFHAVSRFIEDNS